MDDIKRQVGYHSIEAIEDGMVVGLGSGSTAFYMVEALGKKVKSGELDITGVTTSKATAKHAAEWGIPIRDIDDVDHIDITIDGVDEVNRHFQGIKGGGGALLFEKIVASYSDRVIWIMDESKVVDTIGAFPLPVEVVPYGNGQLIKKLKEANCEPVLRRTDDGKVFVTDGGHYIIDIYFNQIEEPEKLAAWLESIPGVIEHGLFLDMADTIIVGTGESIAVHMFDKK